MVSNYSDVGQEKWLASKHIDLLRGSGRLAGAGVVEVDGVAHRAAHVVVATGSDPVVPPVPGLAQLDGVWTSREVTGMKAVPRRLLVLGGGPVGVEMAQAVRRLGGEVVLVEGADRVLAREPPPHSARRSARCCVATESSCTRGARDGGAPRDGRTTPWSSTTTARCAATTC